MGNAAPHNAARERFLAGWEAALQYMRDIGSVSRPGFSELPLQAHHDADRRCYWAPVSDVMFRELKTEWSRPVQVKIEDDQMVLREAQ